MIVLAVLILAAAIVLVVTVVVEGGGSVQVEAFDFDIDTTIWGVFVAGVVTALIALAGLAALVVGVRQIQARRREIEYLRKRVADQERAGTTEEPDEGVSPQTTHVAPNWVPDQGFSRRGRPVDL